MSSSAWQMQRELVIRDPTRPCLLAIASSNGWQLPHVDWVHMRGASDVEPIQVLRRVRKQLGLDATILRRVHGVFEEGCHTSSAVLELEVQRLLAVSGQHALDQPH